MVFIWVFLMFRTQGYCKNREIGAAGAIASQASGRLLPIQMPTWPHWGKDGSTDLIWAILGQLPR